MGTDIHAVWQRPVLVAWEDVESSWEQNRHYRLFGWLADVRNGRGFAGVVTGDPITPISLPRGLPEDFSIEEEKHEGKWMGNHSHGWLLLREILAAPIPKSREAGVVSLEFYRSWDGVTPPEFYSGGIWGQGLKTDVIGDIDDQTTHVQIWWDGDLKQEFSYFLEEAKRIEAEYPGSRLVFGFDS